jgi:hypothetical protein
LLKGIPSGNPVSEGLPEHAEVSTGTRTRNKAMKKMLLVLTILVLVVSDAVADVLTETWPDPLGGWRTRWVAQNTNMVNYYVCSGDPNEDNRGNNPCGLWICDGDTPSVNHDDSNIIFNPAFGATVIHFQIGIESYISDATLKVFDLNDVEIGSFPLPATGTCNPGCGCNTINYALDTPNGIGRFLITSLNQVEGNMAIDNMQVTTGEATPVETSTWGRIKAGYRD